MAATDSLARTLGVEPASTYLASTLGLAGTWPTRACWPAPWSGSASRASAADLRPAGPPAAVPAAYHRGTRRRRPDAADPRNLFRVHWYNPLEGDRPGRPRCPSTSCCPRPHRRREPRSSSCSATAFPMIGAHKVLAAYACLAPRVITGQFDPTRHRAIWPSTGNYARGGVAISRIMGCRGVAVLPAGMSQERFDWLDRWVADPADVIRTPGSESNVKEIYDACNALAARPRPTSCSTSSASSATTSPTTRSPAAALDGSSSTSRRGRPGLRLAAFVSATGSAGTIAAGDRLKEQYGSRIVAVEALECPTMLENGFGEHNIQGIGDKHIPLIHNVMNTDVVVRRQRPRHRRARRAVQHRRRPRLPGRAPRASRRRRRRAASTSGCLVDLQRAGRDQDREAARLRTRRRHHHRRHRRRRAVRSERAKTLERRFDGRSASVDAAGVVGRAPRRPSAPTT